ncbi:SDR family oxidoreductase [Rhodococcus hoagii]|nr:SDR family oxidoreductase [Prescottella equi]
MIEDAGRRALALPGDIRSEEHCRALVESTVESFGGLDILVNNAAYQMATPGGIADISTEQFDRVMKTNLYALFLVVQVRRRGHAGRLHDHQHILHPGHHPSPSLMDYATTKAGIVDFTKALADDVAGRDSGQCRCTGPIWTPLIPATMPPEQYREFGKDFPLGRPGQPAELAPAYVFFASPESSYITGEVLGITGGTPFT